MKKNANETYWMDEQGQFLIGKLGEKYPELTTQKVLEAMEKDVDLQTKPNIFYLFDVFYFCDINIFKSRLLAFLESKSL